jgi:hypothetical protein
MSVRQVETKSTAASTKESLMTKLARAVFACADNHTPNPFASTSLREDNKSVWTETDLSMMDLGDRYRMVEKRQERRVNKE